MSGFFQRVTHNYFISVEFINLSQGFGRIDVTYLGNSQQATTPHQAVLGLPPPYQKLFLYFLFLPIGPFSLRKHWTFNSSAFSHI
jgi:hypothetical protein